MTTTCRPNPKNKYKTWSVAKFMALGLIVQIVLMTINQNVGGLMETNENAAWCQSIAYAVVWILMLFSQSNRLKKEQFSYILVFWSLIYYAASFTFHTVEIAIKIFFWTCVWCDAHANSKSLCWCMTMTLIWMIYPCIWLQLSLTFTSWILDSDKDIFNLDDFLIFARKKKAADVTTDVAEDKEIDEIFGRVTDTDLLKNTDKSAQKSASSTDPVPEPVDPFYNFVDESANFDKDEIKELLAFMKQLGIKNERSLSRIRLIRSSKKPRNSTNGLSDNRVKFSVSGGFH